MPNHILGSDPFNVEDLVHRMFRNDFARVGEITMSAISTIEIACWDIMGKALGLPVYRHRLLHHLVAHCRPDSHVRNQTRISPG